MIGRCRYCLEIAWCNENIQCKDCRDEEAALEE